MICFVGTPAEVVRALQLMGMATAAAVQTAECASQTAEFYDIGGDDIPAESSDDIWSSCVLPAVPPFPELVGDANMGEDAKQCEDASAASGSGHDWDATAMELNALDGAKVRFAGELVAFVRPYMKDGPAASTATTASTAEGGRGGPGDGSHGGTDPPARAANFIWDTGIGMTKNELIEDGGERELAQHSFQPQQPVKCERANGDAEGEAQAQHSLQAAHGARDGQRQHGGRGQAVAVPIGLRRPPI